jgi:hypothetical protein
MLVLLCAAALAGGELAPPVRLEAGGAPIDAEVGHAAPYLYDWDRDGRRDLLVGQFLEGKLRIYRNAGTDTAPRFGELTWFETGGAVVKVPTG